LFTNNVYGPNFYKTISIPANVPTFVGTPSSLEPSNGHQPLSGLYTILTYISDATNPSNVSTVYNTISTTVYVPPSSYSFTFGGNGSVSSNGGYNSNGAFNNITNNFLNFNTQTLYNTSQGLYYYNKSSDTLLVTFYFIKMFGDLTYPSS
jgi:hypothetical protein